MGNGAWVSPGARGRWGAVLAVAGILLVPRVVAAQDFQENVGFSPNHQYESGLFGENVDVTTGNLSMTLPIGPTYQINDLSYGVVLTYNSKIWSYSNANQLNEEDRYPYLKQSPEPFGAGWSFHPGRLYLDPNASYVGSGVAPERVYYENPTGGVHALYPESPSDPDTYFYSKDGSYLRARMYANAHPAIQGIAKPAYIWKIWEHDGTSRVMGFLVNDGQVDRKDGATEPGVQPPAIKPVDLLDGWYTIRLESSRQANSVYPQTGDCLTDAIQLGGIQAMVGGVAQDEVPCTYVEYFYDASLPEGAVVNDWDSVPTSASGISDLRLLYIRDSAGRQIEIQYSPSLKVIHPAEGGQGTTEYTLASTNQEIASPLVAFEPDGSGGCQVVNTSDPTAENVPLLTQVTDPLGHTFTFDYTLENCGQHGVMSSRTLPTGAWSEYRYDVYKFNEDKSRSLSLVERRFHVTGVETAIWKYGRDPVQVQLMGIPIPGDGSDLQYWQNSTGTFTNPPRVYETDPDGNMTVYHLNFNKGGSGPGYPHNGLTRMVTRHRGAGSSGNVISKEEYEYEYDVFNYPWDNPPGTVNGLWAANTRRKKSASFWFHDNGMVTRAESRNSDHVGYGLFRHAEEYNPDLSGSVYRLSETEFLVDENNPDLAQTMIRLPDMSQVSAASKRSEFIDRWILAASTSTTMKRGSDSTSLVRSESKILDRWGAVIQGIAYPDPSNLNEWIKTTNTYDAFGRLEESKVETQDSSVPASATKYGIDAVGNVTWKKFGDGAGTWLDWKAFEREVDSFTGRVTSTTSPGGATTNYNYDAIGRLTQITPAGSLESPTIIEYPSLQLARVKQTSQGVNPTTMESSYSYDQAGRLTTQSRKNIDDVNELKKTIYDVAGRKVYESEWTRTGTAFPWPGTTYEYWVPRLGATGPIQSGAAAGTYIADPLGRVTRVIAADGATTETWYDGLTTTVKRSDLNRLPGTGTQPPNGEPTETTTVYTNDAFDRLVAVDTADGEDAVYTYDEQDNLTRVEMGSQVRDFTYDGLGRLKSSLEPENGLVTFDAYDGRGLLLQETDAADVVTRMAYDVAGRLVEESRGDTDQLLKRFTYDAPLGGALDKAEGRLVRVESWYDDPAVFSETSPAVTREFYYEGLNGRLSKESVKIGPASILGSWETSYYYNSLGLLDTVDYPSTTWTGHNGLGLEYRYINGYLKKVGDIGDPDKYIRDVTYNPAGGKQLVKFGNYTETEVIPDVLNRPEDIVVRIPDETVSLSPSDQDQYLSWARSENERQWVATWQNHGMAAKNGVPFRPGAPEPLPRDLIAQILPPPGGGSGGSGGSGEDPPLVDVWSSGTYSYDGDGNIIGIGDDAYTYDALSRLVSAHVAHLPDTDQPEPYNDVADLTYTYDGYGNMLKRTLLAGGSTEAEVWTFSMHPNNQIASRSYDCGQTECEELNVGYTYDPVGNLIDDGKQRYIFDTQGHLRQVRKYVPGGQGSQGSEEETVEGQYLYDDRGYRVLKVEDGLETYYIRDLQGRVLSEYRRTVGNLNPPGWDQDYLYALGGAFATLKNDDPAVPSGFSMSWAPAGTDEMEVTLSWDQGTEDDLAGYNVYRQDLNDLNSLPVRLGTGFFTVGFDPNQPNDVYEFVDTGIAEGAYGYWVYAIDDAALGSIASKTLVADINDPDYEYVSWLTPAASAGDQQVSLSWDAPAGREDRVIGYVVYRKPGAGAYAPITQTPLSTPGFVDQGLQNGTEYFYKVTVLNTRGQEPPLTDPLLIEQSRTPVDSIPPAPPTNLGSYPGPSIGELTITWAGSSSTDVAGYNIYMHLPGEILVATVADPTAVSVTLTSANNTPREYYVRAYDDESTANLSTDVGPIRAAAWYDGGGTNQLISDGKNPTTGPHHIAEWGTNRFDVDPLTPTLRMLEYYDASNYQHEYGLPVLYRAAKLVINPGYSSDCAEVRIYRQIPGSVAFELLTETELQGDMANGCEVEYIDTAVTEMTHTYRVEGQIPGYAPWGQEVTYTYKYGEDSGVVMGQYAYGASLVRDTDLEWSFPFRIGIDPDGLWELGDLPPLSPVYVTWMKSYDPSTVGYRVWVMDHIRAPTSFELLAQIDDPTVTAYADPEAPVNWPVEKITESLWDNDSCIVGSDGAILNAPRPCRIGGGPDYFAFYQVQAISDLNSPPVAPPWGPSSQTWYEGVRAVRIGDGDCPRSDAFCVDCECDGICSEQCVPISTTDDCGDVCSWPSSWPGLIEYQISLTSDEGAGVFYNQFENGLTSTAWPTIGGVEGLGLIGWLNTSGLWSTYDVNVGVDATDMDERYDQSICYENGEADSRVFRLQGEPGEAYFVKIAAGAAEGVASLETTVVVNGQVFWLQDTPTSLYPQGGTKLWNGEIEEKLVTADANGYIDVEIGAAAGVSSGDTCLSWIRVQHQESDPDPIVASINDEPYLAPGADNLLLAAMPKTGSTVERSLHLVNEKRVLGSLAIASVKSVPEGDERKSSEPPREPMLADRLVAGMGLSSTVRYLHVDHLGSTRVVTNEDGEVISKHKYLPFGEERVGSGDDGVNTHRYTGHERENQPSLDYMLARYFAPSSTWRFLGPDPIESWNKEDPQSFNKYAYVNNRPVSFVDLEGESATLAATAAIGEKIIEGAALESAGAGAAAAAAPAAAALAGGAAAGYGGWKIGRAIGEAGDGYIDGKVTDFFYWLLFAAEHTTNPTPSNRPKHEEGQARKKRDRGGEKGDKGRRPPRKKPKGHEGPWPPPPPVDGSSGAGFVDPDTGTLNGGCDNQCQLDKAEQRHDAKAAAAMGSKS